MFICEIVAFIRESISYIQYYSRRFIAEVRVLLRKFRVNTRKFSTYQNKSMGLRSYDIIVLSHFLILIYEQIKYTVGLPNFCFRSEMYSFDYQIFNYSYE